MSYGNRSTDEYYDVQCPYCRCKIHLCHDDGAFYGEDDPEDCECPECEKTFIVITSISFSHEARCADNQHNFVKYTKIWHDNEWTRKNNYVGKLFYALECTREDCNESRHFQNKEEYDAHPAPVVESD